MATPSGKHILLTGVSGGLGQKTAEVLLEAGYTITGMGSKTPEQAAAVFSKHITSSPATFQYRSLDFSDPAHVKQELVRQNLPDDFTALVLCHGVNFSVPFDDLSWEIIDQSLRINFGSAFTLAQYLVKKWSEATSPDDRQKPDRCIIYVSSVAVKGAAPDELAYHTAKRAMCGAIKSIVRKYTPYGIRANIISPGVMDTAMGRKTVADRPDVLKRIPLGHLVGVEEVACGIRYLLESPSITGVDLDINAGRYSAL